jgi:hypothetical protein
LAHATANVNARIRSLGLSAREVWTQQDQFTYKQLPMGYQHLVMAQHQARITNHPPSNKFTCPIRGEEETTQDDDSDPDLEESPAPLQTGRQEHDPPDDTVTSTRPGRAPRQFHATSRSKPTGRYQWHTRHRCGALHVEVPDSRAGPRG